LNDKCVGLLSLPVGQVVSGMSIKGGSPYLCATLSVAPNSNLELVCAEAYKLIGPIERQSINDTCKYTRAGSNGLEMQELDPQCGMSKSRSYYCPPGYGDLQEQLNQIRDFFSKEPICPRSSTLKFDCKNTEGIEGRDSALAALYLTNYLEDLNFSYKSVAIRNNDACIKKMFTGEYWSYMTDDNTQETNGSIRLHFSMLASVVLIITAMLQVV